MNRKLSALIVATTALTLCSCSWLRPSAPETKETKQEEPSNQLIGRISSIDRQNGFVVIKCIYAWNITPNTVLTSSGSDNRSANLLVTGEAQGNYAAADIQSGDLEIGDSVFLPLLDAAQPKP